MSRKLNVGIEIQSEGAEKDIKELNKGLDQTKKKGDSAGQSAKSASGAFGTLGNAIKSLGIISVISKGVEFFKDALMKNQKVADLFNTAMEFLSRVIGDLIGFLIEKIPAAMKMLTDFFNNPKKYLEEFATAIKNNIQERISSLIDTFGYLGTAIKEVFSGNFDKAIEAAKKGGKEFVDVMTGVNNSVDKAGELISEGAKALTDYTKKTWNAAESAVALQNTAKIAAAQAALAAAQYKKQAEEQRQIRDDERNTIEDRIKANQKLGVILEKQLAQEEKAARLKVQVAANELSKNKGNIDLQVELINAQAELAAKQEEIAGQRSEQLINEMNLLREKADMMKAESEGENTRYFQQKKAGVDLIKDDIARLEAKKAILAEESAAELARLEGNVALYKKGTMARVEAEQALLNKKNDLAQQEASIDDQITIAKYNKELARIEQTANNQRLELDVKRAALDEEQALIQAAFDNKVISEKDFNDKTKALSEARIAIDDQEFQNKQEIAKAIGEVMGGLSELVGKQTAVGKGLAVAQATIDTISSASTIFRQASKNPITIANPAYPYLMAAPAVLGGLARVRQILAVKVPAGGGGGGGVPSISTSAPAVPQNQAVRTQLDQNSINALGNQAIKAYVVETDVTSSQQRINAIKQRARFD